MGEFLDGLKETADGQSLIAQLKEDDVTDEMLGKITSDADAKLAANKTFTEEDLTALLTEDGFNEVQISDVMEHLPELNRLQYDLKNALGNRALLSQRRTHRALDESVQPKPPTPPPTPRLDASLKGKNDEKNQRASRRAAAAAWAARRTPSPTFAPLDASTKGKKDGARRSSLLQGALIDGLKEPADGQSLIAQLKEDGVTDEMLEKITSDAEAKLAANKTFTEEDLTALLVEDGFNEVQISDVMEHLPELNNIQYDMKNALGTRSPPPPPPPRA
jgi:uncharacterized protein Smg (DUF494 family)